MAMNTLTMRDALARLRELTGMALPAEAFSEESWQWPPEGSGPRESTLLLALRAAYLASWSDRFEGCELLDLCSWLSRRRARCPGLMSKAAARLLRDVARERLVSRL